MKRVLMLVTVLFSVFFVSGAVQCVESKPMEGSKKGNLFPAGNDSGWVMTRVDKKA